MKHEDRNTENERSHPPIEEIRSRLKALGYLQSPVERFLSHPAGGPWMTGFLVTAKVSLIAGLILSGLTTASTLLADPAFIRNPVDVFLFLLYLGGAYALVSFCLVLLPAFIWVGTGKRSMGLRHGGTIRSMILSVSTSVVLSAYLLSWWHVVVTESQSLPPLGILSLAVLAAIAMVSLIAGRLMGLVYFLLAGVPDYSSSLRSPLRRFYFISILLVLLLESAWAVGIIRYHGGCAERTMASIIQDHPLRPLPILLIGLDGLDSGSLRRLAAEGKLANLSRLMEEGYTAELKPQRKYLVPQVWTTVATGVKPERHGINHFTLPVLRGLSRQPRLNDMRPDLEAVLAHLFPFLHLVRAVPVSAASRLSKTVWEIIEMFGMPAGVVNWWASWPALPSRGFTVSERTFPKIAMIHDDKLVKPRAYYENEIYPPVEFERLVKLCDDLVEPFNLKLAEYPETHALLEKGLGNKVSDLVRSVYFADFFYTRTAIALASRHRVGFLALYLQGADILSRLDERTEFTIPETLKSVIPEYYLYLDGLIGELLKAFQPSGLVVAVCNPVRNSLINSNHGVVILKGIDVKQGARSREALSIEDVAPTMLYLLGIPIARNMSGEPHLEAGLPGPGGATHPGYIASYGPPPAARESSVPYRHNREMIERLRSLGYVK